MASDEQFAADLLARAAYGRVATSRRALPLLAPARHLVDDGHVLLRMERRHGHHRACAGSVVAYGADNLGVAREGERRWSVQLVGACAEHEPTAAQLERFGPAPRRADGVPFEVVHLRIEPRFWSVESDAVDFVALEHTFPHLP
ncbi:pyridoxamine 5'-phosphate oxidase family protein [Streptomyces sp. NPDC091279]|uniref:pyridoxamine 5'-phosphate oxidase family protein n=1 Tax=unclassified Streptomyces TaxID=2593676 RepID=UPI0037F5C7A6